MIKYYTSNLLKAYQDGVVNKAYINGEVTYQRISVSPQPTPPTEIKWIATYADGHTESAECDASSAITQGEISLTNLVGVEIGNCVNTISGYAFQYCSSLTSVTFGNNVTTIEREAFVHCDALTGVTFPNSVKTIGSTVFGSCYGLTSIVIPSNVETIGNNAFVDCTGLTAITFLSETPPTIGYAFYETNDCPIYVPSCEAVEAYKAAWSEYSEFADRITTIGGCFNFKWKGYYTGGTVQSADCESSTSSTLKYGDIPRSNIQRVEVGDCITTLSDSTFSSYPITSCTLGHSITSIGSYCFENCYGLIEFKIYATTPPTIGAYSVFNGTYCDLQVPAESVDAYKSASGWSDYADRIFPIQ